MRTLNHSATHTELLFDGMTEFTEFVLTQSQKSTQLRGNEIGNHTFRHTSSLAECIEIASTGWDSGRAIIGQISEKLNVSSRVKQPEGYFDVVGDYGYDMGRVCTGEPENAFCFRDSDTDIPNEGGIVKMTVNVVVSAMVDKEIFMRRGAAVVALIDTLEAGGKSVELNVVWCSTGYGRNMWTVNVPLKQAGEALQLDHVAFCLAHPAFVRRMCFIAFGACSPEAFEASKSYCGIPADYTLGEPDIYIPRMHGHEPQWKSMQACEAWVVGKLKEFGVELVDFEAS